MAGLGRTIPALPVRDVTAAVAHYRDRFGFTALHVAEGFAVLERDDARSTCGRPATRAWSAREDLRERPVAPRRVVPGRALRAAGSRPRTSTASTPSPRQPPWLHSVSRDGVWSMDFGTREFATVDGDGNLVSFSLGALTAAEYPRGVLGTLTPRARGAVRRARLLVPAPAAQAGRPRPARRASATPGRRPTSTASAPPTSSPGNAYFTLRQASLSEVYYPDLSTPGVPRAAVRGHATGRTFVDRETVDDDPRHIEPVAPGVTRAGRAARAHARVPPGDRDRALAADEDVDHRPGARRPCSRSVRFESQHRQAAAAVRARRPGAGRRRQRRPRRSGARDCSRADDDAARAPSPRRRRCADHERLPRARRATRGATCRTPAAARLRRDAARQRRAGRADARSTASASADMTLAIGFGARRGGGRPRPPTRSLARGFARRAARATTAAGARYLASLKAPPAPVAGDRADARGSTSSR